MKGNQKTSRRSVLKYAATGIVATGAVSQQLPHGIEIKQ
jgi:hypothetical protein